MYEYIYLSSILPNMYHSINDFINLASKMYKYMYLKMFGSKPIRTTVHSAQLPFGPTFRRNYHSAEYVVMVFGRTAFGLR